MAASLNRQDLSDSGEETEIYYETETDDCEATDEKKTRAGELGRIRTSHPEMWKDNLRKRRRAKVDTRLSVPCEIAEVDL